MKTKGGYYFYVGLENDTRLIEWHTMTCGLRPEWHTHSWKSAE